MRPTRRFAAPIVVTAAALAGCASGQVHDNPPPPAHEPVINPPGPPGPEPSPRPLEPHVNPPPPHTAEIPEPHGNPPPPRLEKPEPALPIAADPSHVQKREDGTCYEFHLGSCPAGVRCNPPPPHRVQCPPGK